MKNTRRNLFGAALAGGVAAVPAKAQSAVKKVHFKGPKPEGIPLFPGAVSYGNFVWVSGSGVNDTPSVAEQTRRTLAEIKELLEIAGSSMSKVLKCNVYLADIRDFAEMNEVYRGSFGPEPPARTTIGVAAIPLKGCRVEIEVLAHT